MNLMDVLLWGFLATIVLTTVMSASQSLGFSRMSIPYMLGTMLTASRTRARILGFLMHMINGWVFAFFYAIIFENLQRADWLLGLFIGLVHGFFILVIGMPFMPGFHPRMAGPDQGPTPTRRLEPPGFMAMNYGKGTPIATIFAHLLYGLLLGAFYKLSIG